MTLAMHATIVRAIRLFLKVTIVGGFTGPSRIRLDHRYFIANFINAKTATTTAPEATPMQVSKSIPVSVLAMEPSMGA